MLFVKKAFDTIKQEAIWMALSKKGVAFKIISFIKALYLNSELAVLLISDSFITNAALRQGPLLPLLFAIVLDYIMSQLTRLKRAIL